ncbi:deoxyribose-phosphate aldolase [Marinitoga sp. 1135]|uniref:Deoxyribose-phosphate aldolase n=2 Tax=Marinitoga TaxID=160798 RepID=H2J323_MARPK|nr:MULTISPECIES: deoxyribose-phosphate aldolase [Marinitoga]AEX85714.1 deoxyribose-phosphate aldolase [Marinitoga piezophila KA3]APT76166.1 deoxyribose-phosphate aldolase [Marinitoga sp. 1137]NUU95922.1 deoxyribose-phosphate aldolase [Marinitoga sp. 1135]NUU97833.1 deoxyribose-phosphate aldolase [Marinitoga sp. 1138]
MDLKNIIQKEIERYNKEFKMPENDISLTPEDVAKYIDHTILKATTTPEDIKRICKEAKDYNFFSVCVNPVYVPLAKEELKGSEVKVATVIGFPLGANPIDVKAYETDIALNDGADEFDMVLNVGMLKAGEYDYIYNEIKAVVEAAQGKTVKVIIETCYLTTEEKIAACVISKEAGAHFVKTSTGFGTGGATAEDVALMKFVVGDALKVKASGGVRSFEDALKMIKAGAERIGASSGVKIVSGEKAEGTGY